MKRQMYYLSSASFTSSAAKGSKPYKTVTLLDPSKDGKSGKATTFFVAEIPLVCDKLHLFDLVECTLDIEDLSRGPNLVSIDSILKKAKLPDINVFA
jgi:hypothetical protein